MLTLLATPLKSENPQSPHSATMSRTALESESPNTVHTRLTTSFSTGFTRPLSFRIAQLKALRVFLHETEKIHEAALHTDLGKYNHEFLLYNIRPTYQDLDCFIRKLPKYARSTKASREMLAPIHVEPHPKGVVLIFAPFNFPIQLVLRPLIAAIAAGNVVCVKPSEQTPASENFIVSLRQVLDPRLFAVVTGGPDVCEQLLLHQWDHILFTGSTHVGRIVLTAAAKFLTPVTLELGGKNPVVVTDSAHVPSAVASIVRSRFANCGQFCLAPVSYTFIRQLIHQKSNHLPISLTRNDHTQLLTMLTHPHYIISHDFNIGLLSR